MRFAKKAQYHLDKPDYADRTVTEEQVNSIGSVRRNPVIADLFYRTKYIERRGSGFRKIVSETEKLFRLYR